MTTTLPLFPEGRPVDPAAAAPGARDPRDSQKTGNDVEARDAPGPSDAPDARDPNDVHERDDPRDATPSQPARPAGLLQQLARAGALRTLDHALAQSLRRLDPDTPDIVLAAAALASLAVASGHAGFDPAQPQCLVDAPIDWPAFGAWRDALQSSRWVAVPSADDLESSPDAPLVYEHGLVYLRRYREYERRLAAGLHRIGTAAIPSPAPSLLGHPAPDAPPLSLPPLAGEDARRTDGGTAPPSAPHTSALPERAQAFSLPVLAGEEARSSQGGNGAKDPVSTPSLPPLTGGARRAEGGTPAHPVEDLQSQAIDAALANPLLLVTGGPGTGKTTTITRLLLALISQADAIGAPPPRIALAAPTGRAAERMAESVRNTVQRLPALGIDPALAAHLPTTGTTLHRLLGTIPDSPNFRHHADHPLPFDLVVVDEASMIDLPLMAKLVEAVPDGARLVLLGDPDQLPSVEAGDVLAGILAAADRTTTAIPQPRRPREGGDPWTSLSTPIATNPTTSMDPRLRGGDEPASDPAVSNPAAPTFPAHHIHLTRNYRQSASLDLAPLATAVREGDSATALSLLRSGQLSGVHFHEGDADPLQTHRDHLLEHWTALADTRDPADALARAGALRILTAVREGPQGARTLNARIEDLLAGTRRSAGPASAAGRHFHGRLLLVTENSYRHRLFNGDIGICLDDGGGTLMAWFPGDDPRHPRPFHPAALPAHDSAFAMTVHKAQGSEFDAIWLMLPARDNRVLSRELVYTGMTRARSVLHLAGSADVLANALARQTRRWSGLGHRLGA